MKILLFARFKELAGTNQLDMKIPQPPTLQTLRKCLLQQYPLMRGLLEKSVFAVNGELVEENLPIEDSAEVALLPPVSGG